MIVILLSIVAIFSLVFWGVSYWLLPLLHGDFVYNFPQPLQVVVIGVGIFVLGQILQKFVLTNIKNFKELIGRIHFQLLFYSEEICDLGRLKTRRSSKVNSKKNIAEVQSAIKRLASELMATYASIPLKDLFIILGLVPSESKIFYATEKLIMLSTLLKTSGFSKVELLACGLTDSDLKIVRKEKLLYEDIFDDIKRICYCLGIDHRSLKNIFDDQKNEVTIIPSFIDDVVTD
jgi:hypothetical protein